MPGLANRVVVVTGASSGIGAALAAALARKRCKVVLAARRAELLEKVARHITASDGTAVWVGADVGDPDEASKILTRAAELGTPWALVNNASWIGPLSPLHECPPAAWKRLFASNVCGPLYMAQAALPGMLSAGEGVIINISSSAATRAYPHRGTYSMTKAATSMLTQSLHEEYACAGIWTCSLRPGLVRTPMAEELISGLPEDEISRQPEELFVSPEKPASAIVSLLEILPDKWRGKECDLSDSDFAASIGYNLARISHKTV